MDKLKNMELSALRPFPDNPFRIREDMQMAMLTESIRDFGVMTPILCRPAEGGEYEIVSGHRRCEAAKRAGLKTVPAFIREMTRDAAVVAMVDCNLQREHLLPSEKAFAYRLKLEAMKRQGFCSDLSSDQHGQRFSSVDTLSGQTHDSRTQIQRYIRLTHLEKPLLDLVDEGRIALTPAVELSWLTPAEQSDLFTTIESEDCTPSLSQAQQLRKMSAAGVLDMDAIFKVMTEVKSNQRETLKIPTERIRRYFKPNATSRQMEDFILKACEYYSRYLIRRRESRDER